MKNCWHCHKTLPLTEFHKDSRSSDGYAGQCRACIAEYCRVRYQRKRERILEATRLYRLANPERYHIANTKAWAKYYLKNADRLRAKVREYCRYRRTAGLIDKARKNQWARLSYKRHPDKYRELGRLHRQRPETKLYHRQYAKNHSDKIAHYGRKYRAKHPEKIRLYKRLYMAKRRRKLTIEGRITVQQWRQILMFYGRACAHCNKLESEVPLTIDHYIPLAKGGKNVWQNVWPLCLDCNMKKSAKLPSSDFKLPHVDVFIEIDGKLQLKEKAA